MALWILICSWENTWFLFVLVKIRWLCSRGRILVSAEPQLSYFLFESNYNINSFFDVSPVWCCASYFLTVALNFSLLYRARNDLWGFQYPFDICVHSYPFSTTILKGSRNEHNDFSQKRGGFFLFFSIYKFLLTKYRLNTVYILDVNYVFFIAYPCVILSDTLKKEIENILRMW